MPLIHHQLGMDLQNARILYLHYSSVSDFEETSDVTETIMPSDTEEDQLVGLDRNEITYNGK